MDTGKQISTDPLTLGPCPKNQKAVALNILITVDKGKGKLNSNAKVNQKGNRAVKAEYSTSEARTTSQTAKTYENPLPQQPSIPNSELLPCGCLIVYDKQGPEFNRNAQKVQTSTGMDPCSIPRTQTYDNDQCRCFRGNVQPPSCCSRSTACCQTAPVCQPMQVSPVPNNNRSVQAFHSERSVAEIAPPPSTVAAPPSSTISQRPPTTIKSSKSKCSRMTARSQQSKIAVKPSQQNPVQTSVKNPAIVPASSTKRSESLVSTKATQSIAILPASESCVDQIQDETQSTQSTKPPVPVVSSVREPPPPSSVTNIADAEPTSTEESTIAEPPPSTEASDGVSEPPPLPSSAGERPPSTEAINASKSVPSPKASSGAGLTSPKASSVEGKAEQSGVPLEDDNEAQIAEADVNVESENVNQVEDVCDGDGDDELCEEECFSFNWSSWKTLDWEKWDKFVSLVNGEPTCAPNLCDDSCCEDNEGGEERVQEENPASGDGWNSSVNYNGYNNPNAGDGLGILGLAEPMSQETCVLLIALPIVFFGIMSSFKPPC